MSELTHKELWEIFNQRYLDPEFIAWQKAVYIPGQYQPVNTRADNLQAEIISQDLNKKHE